MSRTVNVCGNCRYFCSHGEESNAGNCQRFPPTRIIQGAAHFIVMRETEWCGEFRYRYVNEEEK